MNGTDQFLTKIHEDNRKNFFARAAKHLQHRIYLHRIEALLQLELLEEAEAPLNKAYKDIFKSDWKPKKVSLPSQHKYNPPKAVETQLVEHTVTWFYQNAERLITYIRNLKNKLEQPDKISDSDVIWEEIKQGFSYLEGLIKIFPEYWKWVKDNREDERIFYSRWAQILKLGMEAMDELPKLKEKLSELNLLSLFNPEDACAQLLEVTINLYLLLSNLEKLPVIRENRPKPNEGITIELENLRSDDLPDFVGGLSSFYEKISQNLLSKKIDNSIKEIIEKTFRKSVEDSVKMLKRDHFRLLAALDEYHELFGENQQIHSLKRCNERLIWCGDNPVSVKNCYNCLKIKIDPNSSTPDDFDSPIAENFDGLLECQKKMPRDQEQLPYEERNRFDLLCYDYESIMQETEDHLTKHLERHSLHGPTKEALHFVGLQRWNSLTPAQGRSVGGGYFIYRTNSEGEVNLGIAIDPGFDYVRNLFRMGFSLMDVDIVLISHAHADHLWDFESMVQLLNDLKVKKGITHRLNVVLTLGSYQRLEHIIKNPKLRRFINPLVIDIRKEIEPGFFNKLGTDTDSERFNYCFAFDDAKNTKKNTKMMRWHPVLPNDEKHNVNSEIEIWPTRAYHDDYSERSDSFGFLINVTKAVTSGSNGKKFCFGYTGDTKWVGNDLYNQACPADDNDCEKKCSVDSPRWEDVASQYTDCDVLLMHLGSLIDHKDNKKQFFSYYSSAKFCEKLIREKNHPYLMGMIRFLRELYNLQPEKKKLILMGEFGEELRGGIRIDLVKRLRQGLTEKWSMLPVDVGLDILLHDYADSRSQKGEKYKFLCALCDKHRFLSEVDYLRFGPDEAIFYTCKTCKKAIPYDVRDTRLRQLYDIGRELEPSHNQTNHA